MTKNATLILDSFSTFLKCIMINACHNNPMTCDEAVWLWLFMKWAKLTKVIVIMYNV